MFDIKGFILGAISFSAVLLPLVYVSTTKLGDLVMLVYLRGGLF